MPRALGWRSALAGPALAATYVVDDTSTIPYESNLVSRWRQGATGRQLGNDIEAAAMVTVRLNVAPWLNRNGRIYLALPQQPIGSSRSTGRRRAACCPARCARASARSCTRVPIRTPVLEDNFPCRSSPTGAAWR